jgi:hypothetical protein
MARRECLFTINPFPAVKFIVRYLKGSSINRIMTGWADGNHMTSIMCLIYVPFVNMMYLHELVRASWVCAFISRLGKQGPFRFSGHCWPMCWHTTVSDIVAQVGWHFPRFIIKDVSAATFASCCLPRSRRAPAGLAFGLALAVRPAGLAEVSRVKGLRLRSKRRDRRGRPLRRRDHPRRLWCRSETPATSCKLVRWVASP